MKVNIIKFDHLGRGIGKLNEKVVFVSYGLPNELVDIQIVKSKKKYSDGRILKVIEKNPERINPVCPFFEHCGGCHFLHASYDLEKEFKINKAKELLGQCDGFYETKDLNYRNKVTLHIKDNKIGFYEEKTNSIVNIDYCYLLKDGINKIICKLNKIDLLKYNISQIIIKENQNRILMDVVGTIDEKFKDFFPDVDIIVCNNKVVKKKQDIIEKINDKVFVITSKAFFQVNKSGLENIYLIIKDFLKDKHVHNALDLYSGTAIWSILISDYVDNITSIEINKEACLNAKKNLKNNNIKNIKIINGDVKDYIDSFSNVDLVIIDPPRSGLDKKIRVYLNRINSKYIIYISCDMFSLKRDLEELNERYSVNKIILVDMFKRTYHCETVCILERAEK